MEFNTETALVKIQELLPPEVVLSHIRELASVQEFAFVPVEDSESERLAVAMYSKVTDKIKEITTERLRWTRPIDAIKKVFTLRADEISEALIQLAAAQKKELLGYRQLQEDIRKKEEARLLALSQKRTERAIASGKPPPLPEDIIPYVSLPDKTVHTDNGSKVTYTKHFKAYLVDINQVPLYFNGVQLLEVNMTQVQKLVNAGIREIPGIEIKEEIGTRVG